MGNNTLAGKKTVSIGKLASSYIFVLIFLSIFVAYLIINQGATTWSSVMNILRHSAVVGILSFGMGLVIITGGIDLSVGSMLSLVGGLTVVVFNNTHNVLITLLFALADGTVCGLINGLFIGVAQMPAFIVTLATMLIYRSMPNSICVRWAFLSIAWTHPLPPMTPSMDLGRPRSLPFLW